MTQQVVLISHARVTRARGCDYREGITFLVSTRNRHFTASLASTSNEPLCLSNARPTCEHRLSVSLSAHVQLLAVYACVSNIILSLAQSRPFELLAFSDLVHVYSRFQKVNLVFPGPLGNLVSQAAPIPGPRDAKGGPLS